MEIVFAFSVEFALVVVALVDSAVANDNCLVMALPK